jgi:putative spermidine/putrescine transport system substrate-binding protein
VIPKGSKQNELAHEYISYSTEVPQQEAFAEAIPYGLANPNAKPDLSGLEAEFYLGNPDIADQGMFIDQQWWADNFDEVSDRWTKWASS